MIASLVAPGRRRQARVEADRSRDGAIRERARAGRVVAGSSATTGRVGDARSAYGSSSAGGVGPCTVPGARQEMFVVAQEAAGPVSALAGRLKPGIAALRPVRSLPALARQPRELLAGQTLPYRRAQATAALKKYCRQIGATDSTLTTGICSASQCWQLHAPPRGCRMSDGGAA
jgi:hypothetical protein